MGEADAYTRKIGLAQIFSFETRLDEKPMKIRSVHRVHEYFEEGYRLSLTKNGN
jgi:hypothetical protein